MVLKKKTFERTEAHEKLFYDDIAIMAQDEINLKG